MQNLKEFIIIFISNQNNKQISFLVVLVSLLQKNKQTQRFYSQVHKKIGPLFIQREPIRNLNEFLLKSH